MGAEVKARRSVDIKLRFPTLSKIGIKASKLRLNEVGFSGNR